jgi:hypothetical protein
MYQAISCTHFLPGMNIMRALGQLDKGNRLMQTCGMQVPDEVSVFSSAAFGNISRPTPEGLSSAFFRIG